MNARHRPEATPETPQRWRSKSLLMLVLTVFSASLAWVIAALVTERELSVCALLMAAAVAHSLNYWGAPARLSRVWLAVFATLTCIVLARWWITAGFIGQSLGLYPNESITRLGLWFAGYLNSKALGLVDICLFAAALLLAAWWTRPRA